MNANLFHSIIWCQCQRVSQEIIYRFENYNFKQKWEKNVRKRQLRRLAVGSKTPSNCTYVFFKSLNPQSFAHNHLLRVSEKKIYYIRPDFIEKYVKSRTLFQIRVSDNLISYGCKEARPNPRNARHQKALSDFSQSRSIDNTQIRSKPWRPLHPCMLRERETFSCIQKKEVSIKRGALSSHKNWTINSVIS